MAEEMKKELSFDDQVVKKIAGIAVQSVPGILGLSGNIVTNFADRFRDQGDLTKGVNADIGTKQTAIDLSVIGEYGKDLSRAFDEAFSEVKNAVKYMTGLDVVEFNLQVNDVLTKEQYQAKYEGKDPEDK